MADITRILDRTKVDDLLNQIFSATLHAQRVKSLANGVDGVLHSAELGVRAIGAGLAAANELCPKSAIKQVDRFFSNVSISMPELLRCWVHFVVAARDEILVNFDWTDFDASDQTVIVLGMQTGHGRSTPLLWKTVRKSTLKDQRNNHEDDLLVVLHTCLRSLDRSVRVTVVADRGFSDIKLYDFLTQQLKFDFIVRFRGVVHVGFEGDTRKASEWTGVDGRMRVLRDATVTAQQHPVPVVVCVKQKGMKDTWCLASSRADISGAQIKALYGKRFTIEESFRDLKNARLGMGLKGVTMKRCDRRDKLMLLATIAHTLLTLLGTAGRDVGMEKWLGASRPGEMSLFRIGQRLFEHLPSLPDKWARPLTERFDQILREHATFSALLGFL
jgi:hypothetical protein